MIRRSNNGEQPHLQILKTFVLRTPECFYYNCLQALSRLGTTEEMGKACLFLATDATFCTGAELMCTGGADIGIGIKNIEDNPYI